MSYANEDMTFEIDYNLQNWNDHVDALSGEDYAILGEMTDGQS